MTATFNRRQLLQVFGALGLSATAGCATSERAADIFDCHCHIIDPRYPIIPNQGYTPPSYVLQDYLRESSSLGVNSGAIVSGSFHGNDQTYLRAALAQLGPRWVGVTQIAGNMPDAEIASLASIGVKATRFNLFRGRVDSVDDVVALANRVHAVGGWHAEMYADAAALRPHVSKLSKLPKLVIDHMGMTDEGLPVILDLVDAGVSIKATGFGRVRMSVPRALEAIAKRNPNALMFGTDLPSTRAKRPFEKSDITLIHAVLGDEVARKVMWDNAVAVYRPKV